MNVRILAFLVVWQLTLGYIIMQFW